MVLGGVLDGNAVAAARATSAAVVRARRRVAAGQYELAVACLDYADQRREGERAGRPRSAPSRPEPGAFVADELAMMLRQQPWPVRCLIARSRRIRSGLPAVWRGFRDGAVDADQVLTIDRIARRATHAATVAALDEEAVAAAQTRSPKQLGSWLLRLVVQLEPEAFAARHRRALADRRVTVAQGPDGVGYVTGEMTAADAAAIDGLLTAAARDLGSADPRTEQQRRADLFTDVLLGRLRFDDGDHERPSESDRSSGSWLEVEEVDPLTGELLGTHRRRLDSEGSPLEPSVEPSVEPSLDAGRRGIGFVRRPQTLRIGVVVPLSSLLGLTDTPGELPDRSGFVSGETLRDTVAELLGTDEARPTADRVLFSRLLTDDGGRLLDLTELGRFPSRRLAEAVRIRAGTCRHPTCSVPADRCDLDHREPHPRGPTAASNLDPGCRRHHRGKTFAWLAQIRDGDTVSWTLPDDTTYRVVDDPLPTGLSRDPG